MTYTVTWTLTAIQQLNQLSTTATDPQSVQRAAASIDYVLRRVPRDVGESRSGDFRVWYEGTLGVYYAIDDVKLTVRVLLVGPARRR
jgi:mRNA-degrading endonuclease RelE of RelBE toxin-antitoxin system